MSGGFETVLIDIIGRDKASGAFDKAAASAERSAKKMNGAVATAAGVGAKMTRRFTVPLLAIAAVSTKVAVDYQKSMTLLQTAGGESSSKMAVISKGIQKVAVDTGTTLGNLSEGMYTVAKAGGTKWSAVDQLKILRAAAQGAKAENVDMATSVTALTSVMASYGYGANKAVAVQNMLIRGSGLAKTTMTDFVGSLSNVVPLASSLHIGISQVLGAIDTMTQHGETAQRSTDNLANLISALAGQNNVASSAMQQMGINTVQLQKNLGKNGLTGTLDIVEGALAKHSRAGMEVVSTFKKSALATKSMDIEMGTFHGTLLKDARALLSGKMGIKAFTSEAKSLGGTAGASALQFLSAYKSSKGFSDQLKSGNGTVRTAATMLQKMLGGVTGMRVALMLGGTSAAQFAANTKAVGKAALNAGADVLGWNKTSDTLAVKMDKAKASLQVLALEIGNALIPAVTTIVGKVMAAVHWFEQLSPSTKKIIGISALVVAALGPVITIVSRVTLAVMTLARTSRKLIGWGTSAVVAGGRFAAGMRMAEISQKGMATTSYTSGLKVGQFFRTYGKGLGILTAVAAATYYGGRAISNLTEKHNSFAKVADNAQKISGNFKKELIASNGALTDNVKLSVAKQLQDSGLADKAKKAGISLLQLTTAVTSGSGATLGLIDTWRKSGKPSQDTLVALGLIQAGYAKAQRGAKSTAKSTAELNTVLVRTSTGTRELAAGLQNTYAEQVPRFTSGLSKISAWYGQVSKSGKAFISSVQAFAKSNGTVADRGALIGQTLVAANGNALNYAASMNAAAVAHHNMVKSLQQAAKDAFPKSQNAAKAYAADIVNLQTGTINYSRKGAGVLISGLQDMQTAAMNAASATFQLARQHEGGKKAADEAYKVYKAKTQGQLVDEAAKLGLTTQQATALSKRYFNMPKRVKTMLEAEGTNPIVTVLNKIGTQLSFLTGHKWQTKVDANVETAIDNIRRVGNALEQLHGKTVEVKTVYTKNGAVTMKAAGGAIVGPGSKTSDSIPARLSNGEHVWTADEVTAAGGQGAMYRARGMVRAGVLRFATGGAVNGKTKKPDQGTLAGTAGTAVGAIGQAPSSPIDVSSVGIARISAQIAHARAVLQEQIDKGLGSKAAAGIRAQINALAKEAAKQLGALKIKIGHADVSALKTAVHGTVDDARAAFATLLSDSRAAGLAAWRIASITRSQAKIVSDMRQRDALQAKLGAPSSAPSAYDKLATARSNYNGEHDSAKSAVLGGFDITTAGAHAQTYGDQAAAPTTGKSILSSIKAMVAKAKTFRAVLGKLAGMGLAPTLLSKLAQAGPDALDQAQALASGGAGTVKAITSQYKLLDRYAASTGRLSADAMFGKDVNAAQTGVADLTKSIANLNGTIDKLTKGVAHVVAPPKHTHKAGSGSGKGRGGDSGHHGAGGHHGHGGTHHGRSVVVHGGIHITQQKDAGASANAVMRRLVHLGAS